MAADFDGVDRLVGLQRLAPAPVVLDPVHQSALRIDVEIFCERLYVALEGEIRGACALAVRG
jgi:hypothetical protein